VDLMMAVSAALILTVGLTGWGARASLVAMVVLLLAPVGAGLTVWARNADSAPELG
jgi:multisubunit Na+/H+ antiporter MnhG subunit